MDQPDSVITSVNQANRSGTNADIINRGKPGSAGPNTSRGATPPSTANNGADSPNKVGSKRPKNTALKQQRLPAWQPILTAKTVLPLFFAIGVIFVVLGGVLLHYSDIVNEKVIDYTDCISNTTANTPCSQIANSTVTCYCEISFRLETDFQAPVYFYYGLKNYYQNHRRYVKSRDDNQLLGRSVSSVSTDCAPFDKNSANQNYAPCGAIANSLFNDSLNVKYLGSAGLSPENPVPVTARGIAWTSDYNVKFNNPTSWANTVKPVNWPVNVTSLSTDPEEYGYKNEDLIVWMRTAALPSFRKFYRRVDHSSSSFSYNLPTGTYKLVVSYNYPVTMFSGRKLFIISTTSWLGGKNPFLGIAYLVVGSLCIVLGFVFLFIHFKFSRNLKPVDEMSSNKVTTST